LQKYGFFSLKSYISLMKNKITGYVLILAGCVIAYLVVMFIPFGKNVNLADFFKGFAIGVGAIAGAALVVLLIKKARESADTAKA
jgi:hypothetical protein